MSDQIIYRKRIFNGLFWFCAVAVCMAGIVFSLRNDGLVPQMGQYIFYTMGGLGVIGMLFGLRLFGYFTIYDDRITRRNETYYYDEIEQVKYNQTEWVLQGYTDYTFIFFIKGGKKIGFTACSFMGFGRSGKERLWHYLNQNFDLEFYSINQSIFEENRD